MQDGVIGKIACGGGEVVFGCSLYLSVIFSCKPKTALKNKIYFLKSKMLWKHKTLQGEG